MVLVILCVDPIYPQYSGVLDTCLVLRYWFFGALGSESVKEAGMQINSLLASSLPVCLCVSVGLSLFLSLPLSSDSPFLKYCCICILNKTVCKKNNIDTSLTICTFYSIFGLSGDMLQSWHLLYPVLSYSII